MMGAIREWFSAADRRVSNAWLLTATLIVALACTAETLFALMSDAMPMFDTVPVMVFIAAVIVMAFRPVSGSMLVALLWTLLCISPVHMPSALLFAILLAVGIAGYANRRIAVIVAIVALSSWMFARGGVALPNSAPVNDTAMTDTSMGSGSSDSLDTGSDTDMSGSDMSGSNVDGSDGTDSDGSVDGNAIGDNDTHHDNDSDAGSDRSHVILGSVTIYGVTPVVILFIGFMLGGMAARWNHERHQAQLELAYRRRRERAAHDIHDYVSNDLAYLILRMDKDLADGKTPTLEELQELREVAMGALDRTHKVIGVIEGHDDDAHAVAGIPTKNDTDGDRGVAVETAANTIGTGATGVISPSVNRADCPLAAQLRDIAHTGDHRLKELGFEGQTIVSNANDTAARNDMIAGLLEELYGNIAKHAEAEQGYVLTVGIGLDSVQIALIDTQYDGQQNRHANDTGKQSRGAALAASSDALPAASPSMSSGTGLSRYRQAIERRGGELQYDSQDGEWTLSAIIPL
ncbi:2CS histidine protein kinase [Bifidobacterium goeldii]|uniref:2CS histidine protein kinase n=1 Tax=Bifidobacterium goeldii TaxID=2306975 RepID=A0A430FNC3_9BIFI|nr:2CS histidine protein kinase [Bifidobacterium goeldii]RSX54321.1 2CS histidine protein kinase [Bifidobacterium goeldii]